MSELSKAFTNDALAFNKDVADWTIAQQKLVAEQVRVGLDWQRASLELSRDLFQGMGKRFAASLEQAPAAKA